MWVEDDLGEALAVAEIHEDQPPVIAAGGHPARKGDFLPCVGEAEFGTMMGSVGGQGGGGRLEVRGEKGEV